MFPHIKTDNSISVIINDKPYSVTSNHANYNAIVAMARSGTPADSDALLELIKPVIKLRRAVGTDTTGFFIEGSTVSCKILDYDFPLPSSLSHEIMEVYEQAGDLQPLMNFVLKMANNPRKEVIDELWGFISSCGLAITESGNFLAYKNVDHDFMDIFSGTMDNSPGQTLQMPRFQVEHNPNQTCAQGLHFAAWGYLKSYAPGRKTVILSVSPADVVSIPTDYNNMKGRACAYKVLREVEQPEELKKHSVYTDEGHALPKTHKWSKADRKAIGSESTPYDLDDEAMIEVTLNNGDVIEGYAIDFNWSNEPDRDFRITKYRLLED